MRSLGSYLNGIRHPEGFHGQGITKNFFEGWYFKFVSADQSQRWAVIPGIFRGLGGESRDEAFVQVLDGSSGRSWYHRFEVSEFSASPNRFDVRVGGNHFHERGAELDLPQLKGHLEITTALKPWPVTLSSPGIMGWYGLVPFMECFHG
ncbi:MAG: tocopherol cyclase family protein, partial [Aquiluna sp.]